MSFHIATSQYFDFDMFIKRSQEDKGPRHTVYTLSQTLSASIQQPTDEQVTWLDRLLAKFWGEPKHWTLARHLVSTLKPGDLIYCGGEDIGLPIALLNKLKSSKLRLAVHTMAPFRLRFKTFSKVFSLGDAIQLFTVTDTYKADFLQELMGISSSKVFVLPEQTDEHFFTPGAGTLRKDRPLIASAGLEQRDYITLANAIKSKDVDVKICAFSPNASAKTRKNLPEVIPDNMEIRYFEFSELRDLYRSADIVVISLLENRYSAGLTVLMEAMACKKPVVMTKNIGLSSKLMDENLILGVSPGNEKEMWEAIEYLLTNPQSASEMAQRAYDYFLTHHTSEIQVQQLATQLQALETGHSS